MWFYIIETDDIPEERLRAAFFAVCELADAKEVIDPATVLVRAKRHCGGVDGALLYRCMDTAVTAANIRI